MRLRHETGGDTAQLMPNFVNYTNGVLGKANYAPTPFFGIRIDLVVLQMVIIALIFVLHNSNNLNSAYVFAVIASLLGYLLTRTGNKLYGVMTCVIGVFYIGYRHFIFNEFTFTRSIELLRKSVLYVPSYIIEPYLWIIVMSIAVPHLQLLRLGSLRYGNLRGDIIPKIMGHEIFIPFSSAFVFYILWFGCSNAIRAVYFLLVSI